MNKAQNTDFFILLFLFNTKYFYVQDLRVQKTFVKNVQNTGLLWNNIEIYVYMKPKQDLYIQKLSLIKLKTLNFYTIKYIFFFYEAQNGTNMFGNFHELSSKRWTYMRLNIIIIYVYESQTGHVRSKSFPNKAQNTELLCSKI